MNRCFGDGDPEYAAYHDEEWGLPPATFGAHESELFERLTLEVFQAGLAWRLILARRGAFREAFCGFDPRRVAGFGAGDVERLLADPGIIRNRRKIEATITNAGALVAMHAAGESLAALLATHRPTPVIVRRADLSQVPGATPESAALAKALRARGFTFVGPKNGYAMMQALGLVDDHIATCPVADSRPATDAERLPDIWDTVRESTASGS